MVNRLLHVIPLLASFAILCFGHGLQGVLIPERSAGFEPYPNLFAGAMMSAYCIGFILGTFLCPGLIARVGHIRVFAAATSCAATVMLCHALFEHPVFWLLIRVIYGLCLVSLYMVMESWLNGIGDAQSRGKILSVYMIINFSALSVGQLLFFLAPADGFQLFSVCAIMLTLSMVPLILSRSSPPMQAGPPVFFGLRELLKLSPLGVAGAALVGLAGGAYWALSAIYIKKMGFPQGDLAWFMSVSMLGGLLAQWPLGSFSDKVGRRQAIVVSALLVCCSAALLTFMALWENPAEQFGSVWLIAAGAIFGAGFHPLYSLCIAHTNDFVAPEYFVRTSGGLQLTNGIGATIGPLVAGLLMYLGGPIMLFIYIGLLSTALAIYAVTRIMAGRVPLRAHRAPFRMLTKTGLFAFMMDPRGKRPRPGSELE